MTTPKSLIVALSLFAIPAFAAGEQKLTDTEVASGWKMLFDGSSTDAFRGYKKDRFPEKGWSVEEGTLHVKAGGGGGDIISVGEWEDFELSLEFNCAPGANSGIMYRVNETLDYPWMTGPEYQILDDKGHKDAVTASHTVGSLYDIMEPPADKPAAPAGEWNRATIRIKDGWLSHYLNGKKVAETRIDDDAWKDKIAKSKFKDYKGFGVQPTGHIALQDHGDDVWYRNIKIRDLKGAMPGEKALLGKDLSDWTVFIDPKAGADAKSPWTLENGVLTCAGEPVGHIRTNGTYTNFVLKAEWRWPAEPGNSSILWRVQPPEQGQEWATWPKCVEAQLQHGRTGDFWVFQNFPISTDQARNKGKNTRATHDAERPAGAWNEFEIIALHGDITYIVNGEVVNQATKAAELAGHVALHSEGARTEFRNIRIVELK